MKYFRLSPKLPDSSGFDMDAIYTLDEKHGFNQGNSFVVNPVTKRTQMGIGDLPSNARISIHYFIFLTIKNFEKEFEDF